jgi:hypothetical protein
MKEIHKLELFCNKEIFGKILNLFNKFKDLVTYKVIEKEDHFDQGSGI